MGVSFAVETEPSNVAPIAVLRNLRRPSLRAMIESSCKYIFLLLAEISVAQSHILSFLEFDISYSASKSLCYSPKKAGTMYV